MEDLGIYIHIPFCVSKCFYCDFCSVKYEEVLVSKYFEALKKEILANTDILSNRKITSIYFGGGTPSSVDSKYIEEILQILYMFNISPDAEITIEINPKTVDNAKLITYYNNGINRISIGLQTIHNTTLKSIGRASLFEDFLDTYNKIVKVGFYNISIDLIIGLPGETLDMFKDTLNYISTLKNITHVSCYSLEVHENTKLAFLLNQSYIKLPDEEIERDMKHYLDSYIENLGFVRYEISNYAKPTFESKHNLKYWLGVSYLGFGASAASYVSHTRYTNTDDIYKYIENIQNNISTKVEYTQLDLLDEVKEYIILHLRLKDGISLIEFKSKFKKDIYHIYKVEIDKLIKEQLLIMNNEKIYLTDKGEDLANIVWEKFM